MSDRSENHESAHRILNLPPGRFLTAIEHFTPEQLRQLVDNSPQRKRSCPGLLRPFRPLFMIPAEPRTIMSVISWWEKRRLPFNLVVGLCGLPTLVVAHMMTGIDMLSLMFGSFAYGIMANVCFTLGWPAEFVARYLWKEKAVYTGPILLSLGTVFSATITLSASVVVLCLMALAHL